MEQLFFAGKAYLKINSLVKTPLHEFMAVERSGLWAPGRRPIKSDPNGPFPSSPRPLFQNEGKSSAFDVEMIVHSYARKIVHLASF